MKNSWAWSLDLDQRIDFHFSSRDLRVDHSFLWFYVVFALQEDVDHGGFETFERGDALCESPVDGDAGLVRPHKADFGRAF